MISYHKDLFQFGLQRNYRTMFWFDFWGSKKSSVGPNTSNQYWDNSKDVQTLWWTESVAHKFAGRERMCVGCWDFFGCYCLVVLGAFGVFFWGGEGVVWFGLLGFGFFLGQNFLLSPGFKLTPWESTFGSFFSPNLWVLLAFEWCGNTLKIQTD